MASRRLSLSTQCDRCSCSSEGSLVFPCGRQVTLCIACTTTFSDFLQKKFLEQATDEGQPRPCSSPAPSASNALSDSCNTSCSTTSVTVNGDNGVGSCSRSMLQLMKASAASRGHCHAVVRKSSSKQETGELVEAALLEKKLETGDQLLLQQQQCGATRPPAASPSKAARSGCSPRRHRAGIASTRASLSASPSSLSGSSVPSALSADPEAPAISNKFRRSSSVTGMRVEAVHALPHEDLQTSTNCVHSQATSHEGYSLDETTAVPKSGQMKTTHGNGRTSGGDIFSTASRLLSSKSHDLPLNAAGLPSKYTPDRSKKDSLEAVAHIEGGHTNVDPRPSSCPLLVSELRARSAHPMRRSNDLANCPSSTLKHAGKNGAGRSCESQRSQSQGSPLTPVTLNIVSSQTDHFTRSSPHAPPPSKYNESSCVCLSPSLQMKMSSTAVPKMYPIPKVEKSDEEAGKLTSPTKGHGGLRRASGGSYSGVGTRQQPFCNNPSAWVDTFPTSKRSIWAKTRPSTASGPRNVTSSSSNVKTDKTSFNRSFSTSEKISNVLSPNDVLSACLPTVGFQLAVGGNGCKKLDEPTFWKAASHLGYRKRTPTEHHAFREHTRSMDA